MRSGVEQGKQQNHLDNSRNKCENRIKGGE
jgi:hypothetical protein